MGVDEAARTVRDLARALRGGDGLVREPVVRQAPVEPCARSSAAVHSATSRTATERPSRIVTLRAAPVSTSAVAAAVLSVACTAEHEVAPPSILLFVADTARRDVVHEVLDRPNGMPVLARLARDGRLYRNAYTVAPWTLPSHASLFTGALPSEHRVGVERLAPDDETRLLAERLQAAGHQTRGVSENVWIWPGTGLARGFDRLERPEKGRSFASTLDAALADVDPERPLFLFVNVMDAHGVYRPHDDEPFVGEDARDAARRAGERYQESMCLSMDETVRATLLALYRGGLSRADAKLGLVLARLRRLGRGAGLFSIVASDHGQHFGEHELIGHLYSVHEELIRVPLVVHGPDVEPGTVGTPVELTQVYGSILERAGLAEEAGATLPQRDADAPCVVVSQYFDTSADVLADRSWVLAALSHLRDPCGPEHRVLGSMQAVIDYPLKLIEYDDYPPQVYDVERDAGEREDLSAAAPDAVAALSARLRAVGGDPADWSREPPTARRVDRLRALGYLQQGPDAPSGAGFHDGAE